MFHTGDLQSGIALAVRDSKSVICFVRDDSPASQQWERDFLNDEGIIHAMKDRAVALRMGSGSQEASFLTAFCPLNEVPALVLIKNGQLLDLIGPGVSGTDFKNRIMHALGTESKGAISTHDPANSPSSALPNTTNTTTPDVPSSSTSSSQTPVGASSNTAQIQKSQTSTGRSNSASSSSPNRSNTSATPITPPDSLANTNAERQTWVQTQARQNQMQRTERERILKQIEDDKAERRLRAQQQKQPPPTQEQVSNESQRPAKKSSEIRVQVRLFDGSSVRNTFASRSSIMNEIRPWLDHELISGENVPVPLYSLKIINPPQPPRTLDITEEERSLSEIDLGGSVTMVMVPLEGGVDAYESPGGVTGMVGSAAGGVTSAVGWGSRGVYNSVNRVMGSVMWGVKRAAGYDTVGEDALSDQSSGRNKERAAEPNSSNIKIRTLADQRRMNEDDKKQWYNGNQLNFEPKPDDDGNRKDD